MPYCFRLGFAGTQEFCMQKPIQQMFRQLQNSESSNGLLLLSDFRLVSIVLQFMKDCGDVEANSQQTPALHNLSESLHDC